MTAIITLLSILVASAPASGPEVFTATGADFLECSLDDDGLACEAISCGGAGEPDCDPAGGLPVPKCDQIGWPGPGSDESDHSCCFPGQSIEDCLHLVCAPGNGCCVSPDGGSSGGCTPGTPA